MSLSSSPTSSPLMSPKSKAPAVAFEWHTHAKLCDTSPHTCEWIKSTSSGFVCQEEVNVAVDTAGELWHKRLWHMSEKGMRRLADDNLIPEVKNVQLEKCIDCFVSKQNKTAFRTKPPTCQEDESDHHESDENRARPQPSLTSNGRYKNGNIKLIDFTYTMRRHWMLTWKTQTREKPREPTDSKLSTMRWELQW